MSRSTMLTSIRRGLRRGPLTGEQQQTLRARTAAHPRHIIPERGQTSGAARVDYFCANLEKEFATFTRVASADEVPAAIGDFLASQNLPSELVMAPHPELQALPWSSRPLLRVHEGRAMPTDIVGVQHAFAAIAETGTLFLPSAPERPTTVNLLPETQVVVLRASALEASYEDAWDKLRATSTDTATGRFMPRNVMFVTGPSRSADIEQTLELGAHGPRRVHVVLIEDI